METFAPDFQIYDQYHDHHQIQYPLHYPSTVLFVMAHVPGISPSDVSHPHCALKLESAIAFLREIVHRVRFKSMFKSRELLFCERGAFS